eukprot:SAG31_NODE_3654_length_4021_cov_2.291688_4_plen_249_part_00
MAWLVATRPIKTGEQLLLDYDTNASWLQLWARYAVLPPPSPTGENADTRRFRLPLGIPPALKDPRLSRETIRRLAECWAAANAQGSNSFDAAASTRNQELGDEALGGMEWEWRWRIAEGDGQLLRALEVPVLDPVYPEPPVIRQDGELDAAATPTANRSTGRRLHGSFDCLMLQLLRLLGPSVAEKRDFRSCNEQQTYFEMQPDRESNPNERRDAAASAEVHALALLADLCMHQLAATRKASRPARKV